MEDTTINLNDGSLPPLDILYETNQGEPLPLPGVLEQVYGRLMFPDATAKPHVFANYVSTLDGVVTLGIPGRSGGGEISGFNAVDMFIMGLLRAVSDVVILGAGSLEASPQHLWTPEYIYPPLAEPFHELRSRLGMDRPVLTVIVTGRGDIRVDLPVFQAKEQPVLILTTGIGSQLLQTRLLPEWVRVVSVQPMGPLVAEDMLKTIHQEWGGQRYLVEGGPHLLGEFFERRCLDELFLTLAPQVAGRDSTLDRLGLVAGHVFAPDSPRWGTLISLRRGGSHLFLRYAFASGQAEESFRDQN